MSVMKRRMQILIDEARYERLSAEAAETGRSVASIIREAIDYRFADDAQAKRQEAAGRFLANLPTPAPGERGEDWDVIKKAMEDDLLSRVQS